MKIYDWDGKERDQAWLEKTFGNVQVLGDTTRYRIKEIHAIEGPNTLVATVLEQDGRPQENTLVRFGWPTIEHPDAVVKARTNSGGTAGLGMGGGGYYDPNEKTGPHWIEVGGLYVSGLGMLPLTEHIHLDVTYEVQKLPPEEDVWEQRFQELIGKLDLIIEKLEATIRMQWTR